MTKSELTDKERELILLAQALPREVVPPADAWEAIRSQMVSDRLAQDPPQPRSAARPWQRPVFLAAAALLLMAGSAAVTASFIRMDRASVGTFAERDSRWAPVFAELVARENDYLQLVNTLSAAIENESSGLSQETVATIRANLRVIDAAILETRRALADDPANRRLVEILASTYEKKLDLLRRTTAMARS